MSVPALEFIVLPAIAHAAIDDGDLQIREPRVIADGGFHLRRQFAGGFQDERARAGGLVVAQFGQDGQAEGGGFAGAGLRAADDVASRQHERDGAELNGRRVHVPHGFDALQHDR